MFYCDLNKKAAIPVQNSCFFRVTNFGLPLLIKRYHPARLHLPVDSVLFFFFQLCLYRGPLENSLSLCLFYFDFYFPINMFEIFKAINLKSRRFVQQALFSSAALAAILLLPAPPRWKIDPLRAACMWTLSREPGRVIIVFSIREQVKQNVCG